MSHGLGLHRTDTEQISEDQVQRDLFGHKSGSIFPKLLCSVSVREGEGSEKQGRVQLTMAAMGREDLSQADLLRESMVLGFGENSKLTDNIIRYVCLEALGRMWHRFNVIVKN